MHAVYVQGAVVNHAVLADAPRGHHHQRHRHVHSSCGRGRVVHRARHRRLPRAQDRSSAPELSCARAAIAITSLTFGDKSITTWIMTRNGNWIENIWL